MKIEELKKPFPPDRVSWRVGAMSADKKSGLALAYIDARDVQDRLDEVCGPENWQCAYPHANGKTVCSIGVRINGEWVWKADGAGDTDVEAEKGALSDAFKRAAVRWGIGRYLYDVASPWVKVENKKILDSELPKLRALLSKGAAPVEHKPSKAAEWAVKAQQEVRAFTAAPDLTTWLQNNSASLEKLEAVERAAFNTLQVTIKTRKDELERKAA